MPNIQLAPSLSQIKDSRIRELGNVALGMEGVLRLQFGESTRATPQFIKDAATQAMAEGYTFYSENQGLPSLREAIAQKMEQFESATRQRWTYWNLQSNESSNLSRMGTIVNARLRHCNRFHELTI